MPSKISAEEVKKVLKSYFTEFSDDLIDEMISIGSILEAHAQDEIITQDDLSSDVFLLIAGRLRVMRISEHGETNVINEIAGGEFFGEMAIFSGGPRSSSVSAIRHSVLLKIEGEKYERFLGENIKAYKYMGRTLIRRLTQLNDGPAKKSPPKNICLLELHEGYPLAEFSKKLNVELSKFGKTLVINKTIVNQLDFWNEGNAENTANFHQWLYSKELDYDYVLLECEISDEWWTKLILAQADKLILVGEQEKGRALNKIEREIIIPQKIAENIEQVLVLDWIGKERIINSEVCQKERSLKNTFHLKDETSYARIARFLTGNAVKLVLSGGGAKGFAHLGVYRAMKELNIPVDFVGGTSMGAIMAVLVATGWPIEEIMEKSYNSFVKQKPLSDYQFPLVSLIGGNKLEKSLEQNFKEIKIEDLDLPFFAIASNLSKARTEILDSGLVRKALRASISLPSILPPSVHGNSLLLDGGVVDNMPFDHMSTLAEGPTIGVDLSQIKERTLGYDKIPSFRKLAWSKISGSKKYKVPNIYQIIMGTMTLASDEKRKKNMKLFDVYIQPNLSKYGFLDLKKFSDIVEEGYQSSFEVLKNWHER